RKGLCLVEDHVSLTPDEAERFRRCNRERGIGTVARLENRAVREIQVLGGANMKSGWHIDLGARAEGDAGGIDEEEVGLAAGGRLQRDQAIDGARGCPAYTTDYIQQRRGFRSEDSRVIGAHAERIETMEEIGSRYLPVRLGDGIYVARNLILGSARSLYGRCTA